ncbi:MAG: hypothetical protein GY856_46585 [bacterium]|nr:hypothetical protein [bacterium]
MKYLQPLFCTVLSTVPKWSLLIWLVLVTSPQAASAFSDHGDSCRDASRIPLNHIVDGSLGNAEDLDVIRLDFSVPGLLAVEVTSRGLDSRNPTLTYLGTDCERALVGGISRRHSSPQHLLRIGAAGAHYFHVASSDPMQAAEATYRLHVAFADARDSRQMSDAELTFAESRCVRGFGSPGFHKVEEPMEPWDEDSTSPPPDCSVPEPPPECNKSADTAPIEMIWTCDGEGNRDGLRFKIREPGVVDLEARRTTETADTIRLSLLVALREGEYDLRLPSGHGFTDGDMVRGRFYATCRGTGTDDHGETFSCASAVEPGTWLAAEIRGDLVPDRDTFTFVLESEETLVLESLGTLDTYGELVDEDGRRLAADDDQGRFENFRIVETLGPGRYYLRVGATGRGEGTYSLRTNTLRDVPDSLLFDE